MEGLSAGGIEAPAAAPWQTVAADRSPYTRADLYDLLFRDYVADLDFYLAAARAADGAVAGGFDGRPAPEHQGSLVVSAWRA
jgi:hypothetical protein